MAATTYTVEKEHLIIFRERLIIEEWKYKRNYALSHLTRGRIYYGVSYKLLSRLRS